MHLQPVSSNNAWPTNSKFDSNFYRHAYNFSEATLKLDLSARNSQHVLAEILMKAGIISRYDATNPSNAGRWNGAKESFARIVDKFRDKVLTLDQAIVAVSHVHLTGAPLSEALALVNPPSPGLCETVIDFLQQTGLVTDKDIESLNLKGTIEPKLLNSALLAAGVIDGNTLRNATRLRYLLNKGELNFEQAKVAMHFCLNQGIDAEECVQVSARLTPCLPAQMCWKSQAS